MSKPNFQQSFHTRMQHAKIISVCKIGTPILVGVQKILQFILYIVFVGLAWPISFIACLIIAKLDSWGLTVTSTKWDEYKARLIEISKRELDQEFKPL